MRVELRDGDADELRRRVRSESDAAARDRCRAVLLAGEGGGRPGAEIAAAVGRSKRWVDRWLARYRWRGLAGLEPGKAKGAKPTLTPAELAKLNARMAAPGTAADGGRTTLRGKDARRIIAAEFGKAVALSTAYKLLHDAGLSCLRPRPRHRKNDPGQMKAWLERAPLLSAPCGRPTRAGG